MGRGPRSDQATTTVSRTKREEVSLTPHLDHGVIRIIDNEGELKEVLRRWKKLGPQTIALDLECAASPTVPNGSGLHPHLGTIRLIQLGVSDGGDGQSEAIVVDAWKTDIKEAMGIIEDPAWPTLVHYAQMETRWLDYAHGTKIGGLLDTCKASKLIHETEKSHNLGTVVERELGQELSKEQQNSYWDAVELTAEQIEYAGKDVLALLDVWAQMEPKLNKENFDDLGEHSDNIQEKSTEAKGCESERALDMIRACRSVSELEKIKDSGLPHMRIHHSNRAKINRSISRANRRLTDGGSPRRPVKVKVASWRQPF
jgi:ribonuclease D